MKKIANEVFNTYEKWEAFIELIQNKHAIEEVWSYEFQNKIKSIVNSDFPKWKVEFEGLNNLFFSPKELPSRKSLELWIEHADNNFKFSFWANDFFLNVSQVNTNIRNVKYAIEELLHDNIDITDNLSNPYLFQYPIKYDLPFLGSNSNLLSFHLNKSMPEQIVNFIRPFLESSIIFEFVSEVNKTCMVNK